MTLLALLDIMSASDIRLEVIDGRLRVDAPRGVLTPAVVGALGEHKTALMDRASSPWPPRPGELASWSIERRQQWGELANQFEAEGLSWDQAERMAFEEVKASWTMRG
jgi:hypothetical protein